MAKPQSKPRAWASFALVSVPLFAILAAAGWFAARAWISLQGPPMPAIGYLAMALGVIFSVVLGCGLMALLFYSNRHGYDEPFRADERGEEVGTPPALFSARSRAGNPDITSGSPEEFPGSPLSRGRADDGKRSDRINQPRKR